MSTNKALVLIDGSNVYFAQKKVGKQLDWVKVLKHLRQTYTLIAVRYYAGLRRGETSADSFHKKLGRIGIQVITKEVKTVTDEKLGNFEKCNFDVEMAIDAVDAGDRYDTLILFSGDSDFVYLCKFLQKRAKRAVVYSSMKTISWELRKVANELHFIEDNLGLTKDHGFVRL